MDRAGSPASAEMFHTRHDTDWDNCGNSTLCASAAAVEEAN